MTALIGRVLPFLNKALPAALSIKGLEKIDPRIGNFLSSALGAGYPIHTALDFIRGQLEPDAYKKEKSRLSSSTNLRPDEAANLQKIRQQERPIGALQGAATIGSAVAGGLAGLKGGQAAPQGQGQPAGMNLSPELQQFIQHHMQQGTPIQTLASLAMKHPQHGQEIQQFEQQSGKKFLDYLNELFGQGQQQQQGQSQAQEALQGQQQAPQQGANVNQQLIDLIRQARQSIPRQ